MSIELGGLSPTISSVSLRACALASDQTAGAAVATTPTAEVVLMNERRFIACSLFPHTPGTGKLQAICQPLENRPFAPISAYFSAGRSVASAELYAIWTICMLIGPWHPFCMQLAAGDDRESPMNSLLDLGLHALRARYADGTLSVCEMIEEL